MSSNVEVKIRLSDLDAPRRRVAALGARHAATEEQTDRYYVLDGGRRVKLRTFAAGAQPAELIEYDRPETSGVRTSRYTITAVRDAEARLCLVPKSDPLVVVRKRREVHLIDNVRIHLDDVAGLGFFLELEAVVDDAHDESRCRAQVERILADLDLAREEQLALSYSDLLARA
jgi:predicted adenylyl cyclase CyaB